MKKIVYLVSLLVCGSLFATTTRGRVSSTAPAISTSATSPVSARAATRSTVVSNVPRQTETTVSTGAPKTVSARAASTQKVIQTTAKVTSATSASGLVDEACKEKYFGCMDSFCMQDNANGARCVCSDQVKTYDSILAQIEKLDAQSLKLATEGVERIDMGEKAGEIDRMVQEATSAVANSDATSSAATTARKRRTIDLEEFSKIGTEAEFGEDTLELEADPLEGLTGNALQDGVRTICLQQVQKGCEKDMRMLQMMYATQIKNDCTGYELELKKRLSASSQKLATAQRAMKDAALEAFESQNKWDLGECITEMKKCVISTGGCGEDFTKCTFYNTGEGLSGNSIPVNIPGASTTIRVGRGTLDSIQSKRQLCETTVVKNCVAVKDQVWPAFLVEIAPTLKSAELIAENNQRMNKLTDIADCFSKACRTQFGENDQAGYDACLGNPAIMASSCQVVMQRSGVQANDSDPTWGFVKAKLAAMRVDACTEQVKKCLINENRCGEDYANCFGLDSTDIIEMCPQESLTACYENGVNRSVEDLGSMITGILLNVDNAQQKACEQEIEAKMVEICGDTATCNAAAFTDDHFGALDICPITTINGSTINNDVYKKSSSGKATGSGWWILGFTANSGYAKTNKSRSYETSYDDTSMVLQTFLSDPEKDPNAQYCSAIKITNTSEAENSNKSSSNNLSTSAGGYLLFFGGGTGSNSLSNSSSSGSSNDKSSFSASISFSYVPDYSKVEIRDKNVTITDDGTTEETSVLPYAYFEAPVIVTDRNVVPPVKMEAKVTGTINDIIKSISESPKVATCLTGRDMTQINSRTATDVRTKTAARFPRMFDSYAKTIIRDGKMNAVKNYEKSIKKSKDNLKEQAITNVENALNQTDYSDEEKANLIKQITSSVNAL